MANVVPEAEVPAEGPQHQPSLCEMHLRLNIPRCTDEKQDAADDEGTEDEEEDEEEEEVAAAPSKAPSADTSSKKSSDDGAAKRYRAYTEETQDKTWNWYTINADDAFHVEVAEIALADAH